MNVPAEESSSRQIIWEVAAQCHCRAAIGRRTILSAGHITRSFFLSSRAEYFWEYFSYEMCAHSAGEPRRGRRRQYASVTRPGDAEVFAGRPFEANNIRIAAKPGEWPIECACEPRHTVFLARERDIEPRAGGPAVADVNNGNGWHNSAHGLYGRTYQIEPLHTGDPKRRRKICTSLVCRELLAFYVSAA